MSRPEPQETAPVSTGLAREDPLAERLVAEEIGREPLGLDDLEAEGLVVEDPMAEEGATAAEAAAAGLPPAPALEDEEPPPDSLVLDAEAERYLEGHDPGRNRGLPRQEIEHLDDWDDQAAEDQENLPEDEQQG
jgi:hypothetical protein